MPADLSLGLLGPFPEPLQKALREHGFGVVVQQPLEAPVVLATQLDAACEGREQRPDAAIIVLCETVAAFSAALKAGFAFTAPPDVEVIAEVAKRAQLVGEERRSLKAFQEAEAAAAPGSTLAALEKVAILAAMRAAAGSTARAAAMLDISVRKVQYKLHEYGMPPTRSRAENEALWGTGPKSDSLRH